jgi:hypothetical protein
MTNVISTFSPAYSGGADSVSTLDISTERGANRMRGFGIAAVASLGLWAAIGYGIWNAISALS